MQALPAPWCASARTAWRRMQSLPLDAVTLMAPLPKPRRIFGIAHNYPDALAERGMALPDKPVLFMKAARTDHRNRASRWSCRRTSAASAMRPSWPP